ncbi:hypothetical protein B0T26DRAFT_757032 [Lasiosphaeria miniovina]|uniref:Uncharacterized protein n=1 Tax=Lasiosphaeria miniovina TaxID=1954250 RepID=A0AA39ZTQ1_9PEZI|nr:uncharacterized protein B0T26DRAFT_757032 [Lasiosphaeria miniovina]KAK0703487.1 hypothetical protein B0T26DRAFT_757032 [Lasiosphaeria miniovina]
MASEPSPANSSSDDTGISDGSMTAEAEPTAMEVEPITMEVEPTATEVGRGAKKIVATGRTLPAENPHPDKVKWLMLNLNKKRDVGVELVQQLEGLGQKTFDVVIILAGIFQPEDFSAKVSKAPNEISKAPKEDREVLMYKGNFGHHGSKAGLNMVGRFLALELKDKGVIVSIVHPSFMRT